MSRKIKFRVWDKNNTEFFGYINRRGCMFIREDGGLERQEAGMGGTLNGEVSYCSSNFPLSHLQGNRYVVEQWTGNKDKNGKDIYEGDIILTEGHFIGMYFSQTRSEEEKKKASFYSWKAKVIWDDGYASFLLEYINQDYNGRGNLIGTAPWAEVIGNIHENPELLDTTPKKD